MKRTGYFGGVMLAAALIAFPASAAAGTKSASATAAGDLAIASATAKCPKGQRATGGGFSRFPTFGLFYPSLEVYESQKIGQRSWRASGQVDDAGAVGTAFTITTFAYCRKDVPSTKAQSATITSTSGAFSFYTADARCSSGKAQAGGFSGPPAAIGASVLDSLRVAKGTWRSRWRTNQLGYTFTSYVYCADTAKPAARSGSASTTVHDTPVIALSQECKRGTTPVAGGFSQPTLAMPGGSGAYDPLYSSLKSGKRWRVSALHSGATGTTLNSIAYCA